MLSNFQIDLNYGFCVFLHPNSHPNFLHSRLLKNPKYCAYNYPNTVDKVRKQTYERCWKHRVVPMLAISCNRSLAQLGLQFQCTYSSRLANNATSTWTFAEYETMNKRKGKLTTAQLHCSVHKNPKFDSFLRKTKNGTRWCLCIVTNQTVNESVFKCWKSQRR